MKKRQAQEALAAGQTGPKTEVNDIAGAIKAIKNMEAKVGPYMVNDLFSIIEDIADDVYGEEMKDEIAKPVIEAVTKAFKASIKREVKKFYNSDSSSVETNEENSTDLVQKRFEHLLKSRQIYCSLDSQYLPYFTDIKDQCASFFIFKLKDGNEVSLLNELFVDRNNSSLQGLFKLKTSIEHFGLSKLLINTYTSEQLKSASINPLFGKKSTPQDIKTKFPLYAGDISCLIAFLYSVICQYIQRIQKHVSMGPHNAEDYVREYSIDKEDLWVSMSRTSVGLDPFSRKTPAVVRKVIHLFWEVKRSPIIQNFTHLRLAEKYHHVATMVGSINIIC